MGMFKNTLLLAQQGNEKAMEKLLNRYDSLEFVRAVSAFKI